MSKNVNLAMVDEANWKAGKNYGHRIPFEYSPIVTNTYLYTLMVPMGPAAPLLFEEGQRPEFDHRVRQIIVGNVQLDAHPPAESINAELRQFDFCGAKCSVTLVEEVDGPVKMLVDCGSPSEREELLEALHANGIESPLQITHLAITHWHIDHCGQLPLFPNAKIISPEWVKKRGGMVKMGSAAGIELALYCGHSCADLVVRVRQKAKTNDGQQTGTFEEKTVAIVGDLFEHENDWAGDECCWTSISLLPDRQALARWLCWKGADWIVPGHGPAFRTKTPSLPIGNGPIFGKIFFDSDPPNIRQKKMRANLMELFTFNHDGRLYRVHFIRAENSIILVNTGGLAQKEQLLETLHSHRLSPLAISHVVISRPAENFCANLGLFPKSVIFLCHDISLPNGPFYAAMDHHFVELADGLVTIWCDLRTNSADKCSLAVLISNGIAGSSGPKGPEFTLIGEQIDEFLMTKLEIGKEEIQLIRPIEK